jgi:hypothetical protein
MRLAGLVSETQYQGLKARLEAQLAAAPASAAPDASPAPAQPGGSVPHGTSTPSAPPPPPPPPAAPWQQHAAPQPGLRKPLIATAVMIGLLAAAFAGAAVVTRSDRPAASTAAPTATPLPTDEPTPTPPPDFAALLAPLRNQAVPAGSATITPAAAQTLVRAFWPVREQGLSRRSAETIRAIEDGSAREWDVIGCTMGCPPPQPRPAGEVRVFVPYQTTYPASFMAEVMSTTYHSTTTPMTEIFVFTRQSPSAPWYISFNTNFTGPAHLADVAPLDQRDFAQPVSPDPRHAPVALIGGLAAYWQHWRDTGTAPPKTEFTDGYFSSGVGKDIGAGRQDFAAEGIDEHATYTADPQAGLWSFALEGTSPGGSSPNTAALTCGTVRLRSVSTPLAKGGAVVQDTDLLPYGNLLRPGSYSSVTVTGLHMTCLRTQTGQLGIEAIGDSGEQTRVVGVPISGAGVSA